MALGPIKLARSAPPVFRTFGVLHRAIGALSFSQLRRASRRGGSTIAQGPAAITDHHCLMLDVWSVGRGDQTGVQRVSQQFAAALAEAAPAGWTVLQHPFRQADQPETIAQLEALGPGDVLLALDTNLDGLPALDHQIAALRARGGRCIGQVHDLLPLSNPEWFKLGFVRRFQRWALWLGANADHLFCSSRATANAVQHWLPGWSDRAADISIVSLAGTALGPVDQPVEPLALPAIPYLLMVGTIEPRKDHAGVLAAFERLWDSGADLALVIAGRPGWYTEWLQTRLRRHRELGVRLFWFDDIDDAALAQLYRGCRGVIAASLAEGYGLPITEAANFGKPVLARRIAPFLEHKEVTITHFEAEQTTDELARTIAAYAAAAEDGPSLRQVERRRVLAAEANGIWAMVSGNGL